MSRVNIHAAQREYRGADGSPVWTDQVLSFGPLNLGDRVAEDGRASSRVVPGSPTTIAVEVPGGSEVVELVGMPVLKVRRPDLDIDLLDARQVLAAALEGRSGFAIPAVPLSARPAGGGG